MTDSARDVPESDLIATAVGTGDVDLPSSGRACAECGEPFVPADYHPEQRHCQRACQMRAHRATLGHVPMGTTVTRVCIDCGEPFTFEMRKRPRIRCDECRRKVSHHKRVDE